MSITDGQVGRYVWSRGQRRSQGFGGQGRRQERVDQMPNKAEQQVGPPREVTALPWLRVPLPHQCLLNPPSCPSPDQQTQMPATGPTGTTNSFPIPAPPWCLPHPHFPHLSHCQGSFLPSTFLPLAQGFSDLSNAQWFLSVPKHPRGCFLSASIQGGRLGGHPGRGQAELRDSYNTPFPAGCWPQDTQKPTIAQMGTQWCWSPTTR